MWGEPDCLSGAVHPEIAGDRMMELHAADKLVSEADITGWHTHTACCAVQGPNAPLPSDARLVVLVCRPGR